MQRRRVIPVNGPPRRPVAREAALRLVAGVGTGRLGINPRISERSRPVSNGDVTQVWGGSATARTGSRADGGQFIFTRDGVVRT